MKTTPCKVALGTFAKPAGYFIVAASRAAKSMQKSTASARRRSRTNLAKSSSPAAKSVQPSPPRNDQAASLLEQATGMLSWEEVKDLIRMSRGIGTPGREMQDLAQRIVGNTEIRTVDDNELLKTFGTTDKYFARELIGQMIKIGSIAGHRYTGGDGYDFAVSVLRGGKPKDQLAAMLLTQMTATHMAIIEYTSRLARTEHIAQHDCADRTLSKMLRVFVMQLDAYNRYQNSGEQKVTVQNVSVSEFGQAIVGNVTQGVPERPTKMPALTQSKQEAMPPLSGLDADLEAEYQAADGTPTKLVP
jgi:hypothetical protein